ncbi:hypothetical protein LTR33_015745, partial [Friedmanniomyces endolithicus]
LQRRPLHPPRRTGLLHRHLNLRMVPGRPNPPLPRPRQLGPPRPASVPQIPARHARQPGQLRRL